MSPNEKKWSPPSGWEKLSDEEQLKELLRMYGEVESFLKMPKEEREKELERRKEEQELIQSRIDLLNLSPEERKKKMAEYDKESKRLAEEARIAMAEAAKFKAPEFLEAEKARRSLEAKEMKELNTDNCDELIAYFETALREKNSPRCGAILKKLAMDGNLNEILNYYGYVSNWKGLDDFTNEILIRELGLGKQGALALESDLSYIAEKVNHWAMARCVGKWFGEFYQMDEKEHAINVVAEVRKFNVQQVARTFNRLAYGGEVPREKFNPGAGRDFVLDRAGLAILISMGGLLARFIENKEFNVNAASNLGKDEFISVMKEVGVHEDFIKNLEGYVKERMPVPDLGQVVEQAFAVPLPPRPKK